MYEWQAIKSMRTSTINEVIEDLDWHLENGCRICKCDCGYIQMTKDLARYEINVREGKEN